MRDKIIKAVAKNETIRIIACSTTDLINHIKQIHKLNELTTIAFGRLMTIASMISSTNKVLSDTIVIKFEGNGPLNNMSAITRGDGTLKGYISNSNAFVDSFKMNDLIGEGFLTITKDLGLKNPYTGKVPLYKSDVCSDLSYYYTLSEQTPTAISVGIDINEDFSIKNSVGIMVQMLPGADEMLSDIISYRFEDLGSIVSNLEKGKTIYDILKDAEGVYGARPSGAGFRGAVIGLIDPAYKESIKAQIDAVYPVEYPEIKDKYEVNFCITEDGARFVDVEELI